VEVPALQVGKLTTRCQSALQTVFPRPSVQFVASVSMLGLVLTPVAVLAGVLGVWRLGADLGWTKAFFIADGLLSRYQLWIAVAITMQASAFILNRWVASRKSELPPPTS
jgi:hypothetical protein